MAQNGLKGAKKTKEGALGPGDLEKRKEREKRS